MNKRDIVIYIAGPFRGPSAWAIEQNIRHAEELALMVWEIGFTAICPHTNTRFFQGALPDDAWLNGDLAILRKCDAVLMTSDWKRSAGANTERMFAEKRKILVFENISELEDAFKRGDLGVPKLNRSEPRFVDCPITGSACFADVNAHCSRTIDGLCHFRTVKGMGDLEGQPYSEENRL